MNHIQAYSKILQLRTTFKRLQQLSWTISKLEQRYDIDSLENKDLIALAETYNDFIPQIISILDELNDEKQTQKK